MEHGYELERVVGDTITLDGCPVGRGGTGNVILRSVRAFQLFVKFHGFGTNVGVFEVYTPSGGGVTLNALV